MRIHELHQQVETLDMNNNKHTPIDQRWILNYVDTLLEFAKQAGDTAMGRAALLRVEHVMDLVKAWQEKTGP